MLQVGRKLHESCIMLQGRIQREPGSSHGTRWTSGSSTPPISGRELEKSKQLGSDVRNATTTTAARREIAEYVCRAGLEGGRRATQLDTSNSHKRPRKEEGQAPPAQPASSSLGDPLSRRQQIRQGKGEGETHPLLRRRRNSRDGRPAHRQDRDDQSDRTSGDESVRTAPEVVDSALINLASRCKGETYLRPTFGRELDCYMACRLRLLNMDHYFPYGPWPLDFDV